MFKEDVDVPISGEQSIKKSKLLSLWEEHIYKPIKQFLKGGKSNQGYADCIIRNAKGEVLLLQRKYGEDEFEAGKWGWPGGKIEEGEDPAVAAKRELQEETGFDLVNLQHVETRTINGAEIHYYEGLVLGHEQTSANLTISPYTIMLDEDEHRGYEWCNVSELKDYTLICDLGSYIEELTSKLFPITLQAQKFSNVEQALAVEGIEQLDFHWSNIQKAFDEGMVDEEQYLKALTQYNELKKGGPGSGRHKEFHGVKFHDALPTRIYDGREVTTWDKKGVERGSTKGDVEAVLRNSVDNLGQYGITESDSLKEAANKLKKHGVTDVEIYKHSLTELKIRPKKGDIEKAEEAFQLISDAFDQELVSEEQFLDAKEKYAKLVGR